MAKFYADRGQLIINGKPRANIVSIDLDIDEAVAVVDTMTEDKTSAGFRQGNRKCTGSFQYAMQDDQPSVDLAFLYGQSVEIITQFGTNGDRYHLYGVAQNRQALKAQVGNADKNVQITALRVQNENGPSVNAQWDF